MSDLYIAKVRIRISGRKIAPGDTVSGLSEEDIDSLAKRGFVKRVQVDKEIDSLSENNVNHEDIDQEEDVNHDDIDLEDVEDEIPEFYTEEQLSKLKSKKDIVSYAESIGLIGLDVNLHRTELVDKVLEYIDEVQD